MHVGVLCDRLGVVEIARRGYPDNLCRPWSAARSTCQSNRRARPQRGRWPCGHATGALRATEKRLRLACFTYRSQGKMPFNSIGPLESVVGTSAIGLWLWEVEARARNS